MRYHRYESFVGSIRIMVQILSLPPSLHPYISLSLSFSFLFFKYIFIISPSLFFFLHLSLYPSLLPSLYLTPNKIQGNGRQNTLNRPWWGACLLDTQLLRFYCVKIGKLVLWKPYQSNEWSTRVQRRLANVFTIHLIWKTVIQETCYKQTNF